jgi:tryptophan-rich sensory protein
MSQTELLKIVACCSIPCVLGYLGSAPVRKNYEKYHKEIHHPWFEPSPNVFRPIWTGLFLTFGFASYLVTFQPETDVPPQRALFYYGCCLILQTYAPYLMFNRKLLASLFIMAFQWLFVTITIFEFGLVNYDAALLTIPYLLWTVYSGYLNKVLWRMNQDKDLSIWQLEAEGKYGNFVKPKQASDADNAEPTAQTN